MGGALTTDCGELATGERNHLATNVLRIPVFFPCADLKYAHI